VRVEVIEENPFPSRGEWRKFGTSPPLLEEIEEIVAVKRERLHGKKYTFPTTLAEWFLSTCYSRRTKYT
jgi:hypothetical protein